MGSYFGFSPLVRNLFSGMNERGTAATVLPWVPGV